MCGHISVELPSETRDVRPPGLTLAISQLPWVLGTDLRFSGRGASTLNHWAIFPALVLFLNTHFIDRKLRANNAKNKSHFIELVKVRTRLMTVGCLAFFFLFFFLLSLLVNAFKPSTQKGSEGGSLWAQPGLWSETYLVFKEMAFSSHAHTSVCLPTFFSSCPLVGSFVEDSSLSGRR